MMGAEIQGQSIADKEIQDAQKIQGGKDGTTENDGKSERVVRYVHCDLQKQYQGKQDLHKNREQSGSDGEIDGFPHIVQLQFKVVSESKIEDGNICKVQLQKQCQTIYNQECDYPQEVKEKQVEDKQGNAQINDDKDNVEQKDRQKNDEKDGVTKQEQITKQEPQINQLHQQSNNQQHQQHQNGQKQVISSLLPTHTYFSQFSPTLRSKTITLSQQLTHSQQSANYYQNQKITLCQPITTFKSTARFQLTNLRYCLGMGIALKQVIEQHSYNYKSYQEELSHGLYIVTTQGYSWSHSNKIDDDQFRINFNKLKTNDIVTVQFSSPIITFRYLKDSFTLQVPSQILSKFTLCFCVYLHEKGDSIDLLPY